MRYTVLIDGDPGAYGVVFPDLPGCAAMGETIEEAMENAGDALRDWMASHTREGAPTPEPRPAEILKHDAEVAEQLAAGASLGSVALVRSTGRPVRANMTLDEGVVAALDAEARRRRITRSALVEVLAREHLPAL